MPKAFKLLYALAVVIFLVAPLVAILPLAFTSSVFLTYPIPEFSTRWFEELATAAVWQRSIVNSLIIGTGATLLATVLGRCLDFAGPGAEKHRRKWRKSRLR